MHPVLKNIMKGLVGIVTCIMVLRLLLVPTYAFIHFGSEFLLTMLMILEAVIAAFTACMVVRYIHRHL
jgi:hypothetical protein